MNREVERGQKKRKEESERGIEDHEGRREKSRGKCISKHCEKDEEKEGKKKECDRLIEEKNRSKGGWKAEVEKEGRNNEESGKKEG